MRAFVLFNHSFNSLYNGVHIRKPKVIDQVVASRGRTFFGCFHSTFSGFIFRMRGYHSQNDRLDDRAQALGIVPRSYYYSSKQDMHLYDKYYSVHGAVYSREYPTSWRDIDKGIDELQSDEIAAVE